MEITGVTVVGEAKGRYALVEMKLGDDRLIQEGVVSLNLTIVKMLLKTICFKKV